MKRRIPDDSCLVNSMVKECLQDRQPVDESSPSLQHRHLHGLSYSLMNQRDSTIAPALTNNSLVEGDKEPASILRYHRKRSAVANPAASSSGKQAPPPQQLPPMMLDGGKPEPLQCCTLPQLTGSPSLGCSRSLRTACAQRYLPQKTYRASSPVAAPTSASMDGAMGDTPTATGAVVQRGSRYPRSKRKRIFVSYSPDCEFRERRLVADVVSQLKQNDMADDIWYDVDERSVGAPCWLADRIEAAERCTAALVFFSPAYFESSTCVYEARTLLARLSTSTDEEGGGGVTGVAGAGEDTMAVFSVFYELYSGLPDAYKKLVTYDGGGGGDRPKVIDLTRGDRRDRAHAELCNFVIGAFCIDLQRYANMHAPSVGYLPPISMDLFKTRTLRCWSVDDVQDWLQSLSVREFYRHAFEELKVDGNLLISLNDVDLIQQLSMESRASRKKILRQMLIILEKEFKNSESWHLRARSIRSKPNTIYVIYDPSDVRIAQSLKVDLTRKQIQVFHHQKLGQTKEEFLKLNCTQLAMCSFVVVILTKASCQSAFVFHELLFADWLNKKLVTAVFNNVWTNLRSSLKAVLGEAVAIDFTTCKYEDSLEALESLIRPSKSLAGIILEQSYLSQMNESIKTLSSFSSVNKSLNEEVAYSVYISYHWDSQIKVQFIRDLLVSAGISCWSNTMECPLAAMTSASSSGCAQQLSKEAQLNTVHKYFKCARILIVALTSKHVQSDACYRDLYYADTDRKVIVVVILRSGISWPLDATCASPQTRRLLSKRNAVIDMSTDRLLRHNKRLLLERIKRILSDK